MRQLLALGASRHEIGLTRPGRGYRLLVDGVTRDIRLEVGPDGAGSIEVDGRRREVVVAVDGDTVHVHLDGVAHSLRWIDPVTRFATAGAAAAGSVAAAPMPGTVVALFVEAGQAVAAGDPLLVIESMKLETTIRAERAGRVATIHVAPGGTFERGAPLVSLAAETGDD